MVTRRGSLTVMLIGIFTLVLGGGNLGNASAADEGKQAKKPKATQEVKAPPIKGAKPKFRTADEAGKAKSCFGEAPKIEKVIPDEGKAGDKVTITGKSFGAAECLRTVSFGPGHSAKFEQKNETTISATVPSGGRKGLALLTVTTASGEDSKPFLMK